MTTDKLNNSHLYSERITKHSADVLEYEYVKEHLEAYDAGQKLATNSGLQAYYWGGFRDGVYGARIVIVEQLLCTPNNLSMNELAAATLCESEAILEMQTRLVNDESLRQDIKHVLQERIAKDSSFTNNVMSAQGNKIAEQKKDILLLFKHIDRFNRISNNIVESLDDVKNEVWHETDTKERCRIYSEALKGISEVMDEFTDIDDVDVISSYVKLVDKYKSDIDNHTDENDDDDSISKS